jgi:Zn-dependent M16 (insulinase) family peptidase
LAETLEDFSESLRWLQRHPHEYHALEEAILGVISAIDRPSSPAGEAIKTFMASLNGRTPDYRRRLRQHVLGVTLEDLKRVAATYLAAKPVSTAVVTDRRAIEKYRSLDLEILVL